MNTLINYIVMFLLVGLGGITFFTGNSTAILTINILLAKMKL